eukprot:SAG22_NODE_9513_length_585_cov_3.224280_1_plen_69_part_01
MSEQRESSGRFALQRPKSYVHTLPKFTYIQVGGTTLKTRRHGLGNLVLTYIAVLALGVPGVDQRDAGDG